MAIRPRFSLLVLPILAIFMSGCAAVGVVETNDPVRKLAQAQSMWEMERYIPAEQLALDSLELAIESGDTLAEANAHRYLGNFYKSALYLANADWFDYVGRHDPTYELSKSHFLEAKELWQRRGDDWGVANEYFNLATVAILQDRAPDACPLLERAIELYKGAIFTGVAHPWNRRFEDFPSMARAYADQVGCDVADQPAGSR